MTTGTILLVDDDRALREALAQTLGLADFDVIACSAFIEAKDHIAPQFAGVILSDIRMPGRDGFFLLDHALAVDPELPVVLLTGEGDVPMAVRAIQSGAFAFLEKPCASNDLITCLQQALAARQLALQSRLGSMPGADLAGRRIFGTSPKAEHLRAGIRAAALNKAPVLIEGAPGSGVSKVAEVLHLASGAVDAPFEKRAGQSLTPQALHMALDAAAHGSLFIDGLAHMPMDGQMALYDLITAQAKPAARIIVGAQSCVDDQPASNIHSDLLYLLAGTKLRIPPLSERPEDIPVLFRLYLSEACEQAGITPPHIPPAVLAELMARPWPGNAHELMGAAMRFAMGQPVLSADKTDGGLTAQLAQVERSLIEAALIQAQGRAAAAAEALQLPRKTFYDKLSRYGLRPEDYR
jgi:two-component system C4-dicarboxylate transport response regulator DctD